MLYKYNDQHARISRFVELLTIRGPRPGAGTSWDTVISALPPELVCVALVVNLITLLRPSNSAIYDVGQLYDSALPLFGAIGFAMLAMRLLPLTLRDLRHLTHGRLAKSSAGWEERIYSRLSAIPVSVGALQAARMTAALSVGTGIIRPRWIAHHLAVSAALEPAPTAIGTDDSSAAIRELDRFDQALARLPAAQPGTRLQFRVWHDPLPRRPADLARQLFDAQVQA